MSDNELLLSISNMMDVKLKPVNDRLGRIEFTLENNVLPRLDRMELAQRKMALTLENNILPRLQNIKDCYTSIYKRYQLGATQIEAMRSDIDVIKKVVTEHSGILQKFA